MKLYYFIGSSNFGDSLNGWLWHRLLPRAWDPDDDTHFAGIGTIINADMPAAPRWIVFGSGVGYGRLPPHFGSDRWTIVAVRGPLSATVLGLPAEAAVTDGAMLLATLPEYAPLPSDERKGVVFVPHFEAERGAAWPPACRKAGIDYINPLGDSRAVVERIRGARLVIAEAMHAAIVADALQGPLGAGRQFAASEHLQVARLDAFHGPALRPAASAGEYHPGPAPQRHVMGLRSGTSLSRPWRAICLALLHAPLWRQLVARAPASRSAGASGAPTGRGDARLAAAGFLAHATRPGHVRPCGRRPHAACGATGNAE